MLNRVPTLQRDTAKTRTAQNPHYGNHNQESCSTTQHLYTQTARRHEPCIQNRAMAFKSLSTIGALQQTVWSTAEKSGAHPETTTTPRPTCLPPCTGGMQNTSPHSWLSAPRPPREMPPPHATTYTEQWLAEPSLCSAKAPVCEP